MSSARSAYVRERLSQKLKEKKAPTLCFTLTHSLPVTAHLKELQVQDVLYLGFLLIIKNRVFGTRWGRGDERSVHGDRGVRLHYA